MKKKVFIGLFLGCSLIVFGQKGANYPMDGMYGGVESGAAYVKVNGFFGSEARANAEDEYLTKEFTKSVVSLNLGYGKYLGESFIALEAHHSLYTKKISESFTQSDFNFDLSISSKSELDLVIGRKIGAKSLLTLRGGIAFSNINITAISDLDNDLYVLDKQWNGYSLGSGYVHGISDNLSIKTKYSLTFFNNKQFPNTDSKLVDNRATVSFIYRIWTKE
ncbi:MAG: hypothetical protein KJO77_01290 [Bacteroidia bacterium]|nr:hypothetical protein [Bacteroidia bacterium]NND52849.1 hypothetical protein [Flavobacteriaceae bacterium]